MNIEKLKNMTRKQMVRRKEELTSALGRLFITSPLTARILVYTHDEEIRTLDSMIENKQYRKEL